MRQAQAAMPALDQSYREQHGEAADSTWTSVLVGANEDATGDLRPAFVSFFIAVDHFVHSLQQRCDTLYSFASPDDAAKSRCGSALGGDRRGVVHLFVLENRTIASLPALSNTSSRFGFWNSFQNRRRRLIPLEGRITLIIICFCSRSGFRFS